MLRLRGEPLAEHTVSLLALLDGAARRAPDRAFLIERDERDVWHQATFATVAARSLRVGAALRALGASEDRPVMIASGNGIDHAMIAFGAMRAGVPAVPVAPAAARSLHDGFARLRAIADAVRPAVVFARDGAAAADGVRAAAPDAALVTVVPPREGRSYEYARLLAHAPLTGAEPAGADTIAKILMAPGDAGDPKPVITTHGMIAAMLQGLAQAWPFLDDHPPVVVDWLPWHHALGGNVVLGIVLRHAGTLYVDHGGPTAERFERTVRLRSEVQPTLAFDVPLGWARWVDRLRSDDTLRRHWLARLDLGCWGGAALDAATRDALHAIGVPFAAYWGTTETAPAVTLTRGGAVRHDAIGVPLAGVELKLVPADGAYEARVRAPHVTPGYWWRPDLTAAAFDEEGYFRTGDLVQPVRAHAPEQGLAYVGRIDERFKLSSGTWVHAAAVRERMLRECSDLAGVIVTGERYDEIGLLVWPTPHGVRLDRDLLRAQLAAAMRRAAVGAGSSATPRRALILAAMPAPHERGALISRLHASEPDNDVIVAGVS